MMHPARVIAGTIITALLLALVGFLIYTNDNTQHGTQLKNIDEHNSSHSDAIINIVADYMSFATESIETSSSISSELTSVPTVDITGSDYPSTEFTETENPSTEFTDTENPFTDITVTKDPSTELPNTEETSTEIIHTHETTTEVINTEKTNTEFPSTEQSAYTTEITITDEPSTVVTITEEPSTVTTSEVPSTTLSPYSRTVIFFHKKVYDEQYVFIRGGIDETGRPDCHEPASTDPCALEFFLNSLGSGTNYDKYDAWRAGDDHLDWFGAEPSQGTYNGIPASGTPMAWTTNNPSSPGYQELNVYGEDYWMLDFDMDCSITVDGWFEFKGWLEFAQGFTGWELDVHQETCSGTAGIPPPMSSVDHMARCGFINVFEWNEGTCIMEPLSDDPDPSIEPPVTSDPVGPERTVIFLEKPTDVGQDVFLRGGLDKDYLDSGFCIEPAVTDPCALPMLTRSLGDTSHYDGYNEWRHGDMHLDWWGDEAGQGDYGGIPALGSPMAWTTNDDSDPGYQHLNVYGPNYWMIDMDIDCSATKNGWITVKGWLSGSGYETDVNQGICLGSAGSSAPHTSKHHQARCGYINLFHWGQPECEVHEFIE